MEAMRVLNASPAIQGRSARASVSPQTATPVTAETMRMMDDLAVTVTVATTQVRSMKSISGNNTVMVMI